MKISKTSRLYRFAAWDKGSSYEANTGCELFSGLFVSAITVLGIIFVACLSVLIAGILTLMAQGMTVDEAFEMPLRMGINGMVVWLIAIPAAYLATKGFFKVCRMVEIEEN